MTKRKILTPLRRLAIFEKAKSLCHICGLRIQLNAKWDVEHIIPLAMDGADDESNWAPAHKSCHAAKSAIDAGNLAKVRRVKAKHMGIKKRSTWQTKWKRKIDGTTVLR